MHTPTYIYIYTMEREFTKKKWRERERSDHAKKEGYGWCEQRRVAMNRGRRQCWLVEGAGDESQKEWYSVGERSGKEWDAHRKRSTLVEGDAVLRDQHCKGRLQWIDGAIRMEVRGCGGYQVQGYAWGMEERNEAAIKFRVMVEGRKKGMQRLSSVGLWLREGSEECGGYQV